MLVQFGSIATRQCDHAPARPAVRYRRETIDSATASAVLEHRRRRTGSHAAPVRSNEGWHYRRPRWAGDGPKVSVRQQTEPHPARESGDPRLAGLDIRLPRDGFLLRDGALQYGAFAVGVQLGSVLKGDITVEATDEGISQFDGEVAAGVPGLASGMLLLQRNELGLVTGSVKLAVALNEQIKGDVRVGWDGMHFSGKGNVGYTGEKLSGEVELNVMEAEKAAALEAQRKPPPEGEEAAPAQRPSRKSGATSYVVFGEGLLDFAFTDWLSGKAQVIIDPKGYLTIIGEITPQAEVELFRQRDLADKLPRIPRLEARAIYGIPVIGNIYVAAGVGLRPFAIIGPGTAARSSGSPANTRPIRKKSHSTSASKRTSISRPPRASTSPAT